MVDLETDPRVVDTMSLGELHDMLRALGVRRGRVTPPDEEERQERISEFMSFVKDDPAVRIH